MKISNLTTRYILALSFIALLSLTAFLTLKSAIKQQETGAAVVNVAGRQRMLSQRISRYALLLVISRDASEQESLLKTLASDIDLFEVSHQTLLNGGSVRGLTSDEVLLLPGNPSSAVQKMYFEAPMNLDEQVVTFIGEARALLSSPSSERTLSNAHLQYILNAAASELLASLNAVTGQYQRESEFAISNLQWLETGVLVITLIALLVEAFLIFRPMVQQVEQRAQELQKNIQLSERQNVELETRTRAIMLSAEVGRRLSTILDLKQLVIEVVEQVKNTFNYYHVHIYLYDEAGEELLMAGGTGEVGQTLLAREHKIPKGKGLVGRAANTNASVLVSDTSQDTNWLPNPLLPDTKSEVAVPISIGDQVLGVLDVQHNITDGVNSDDTNLLQSIANQVAIAVQNARSYSRAEQQVEHEALINSITQKIQETTSIESAMQVVVRELGYVLGSKETRIILDTSAEESGKTY